MAMQIKLFVVVIVVVVVVVVVAWYARGMFVYFAKQYFCVFGRTFRQSRAVRGHKSA